MMKNKRRGFTVVELVIVVAVVAILATVLIPTFSNVLKKADESATLLRAKNLLTELYEKIGVLREQLRLAKEQAATNESIQSEIERFMKTIQEYSGDSFPKYIQEESPWTKTKK